MFIRLFTACFLLLGCALATAPAYAQVSNIKVVTDASPDYHDMAGLVHSITSRWDEPRDQTWALYYWMHKARRQTSPMSVHGYDLADPIMQFNDYGYAMCSTISGIKVGIWHHMGLPGQYWDVTLHTVPQVYYDGRWHMYDNSMSVIYTLCDGHTIAGIEDIGATLGCEASGGREEPGHIAIYHAQNATSPNGFIEGADTIRPLKYQGTQVFNPNGLKHRTYYNHWMWGHRYVLNLYPGEVYTRHYARLDQPESDSEPFSRPGYFVPSGVDDDGQPRDLEAVNPRYRLRGNGERTFTPPLTADELTRAAYDIENIRTLDPAGLAPAGADEPAHVVFKVEGANVITSLAIDLEARRRTRDDVVAVHVSRTNGRTWEPVWRSEQAGEDTESAAVELVDAVNGSYSVLVKVELFGRANADDARLDAITFRTITALNSKTQPQLNLGRNTVYVGRGDETGTSVIFPDLSGDRYTPWVVDQHNVATHDEASGYTAVMHAERPNEEAYVTFRMDVPTELTRIIYGGRLYNRTRGAQVTFLHSFDDGETWHETYQLTDTSQPWDVIEYVTVDDIPEGVDSVLFKYRWTGASAGSTAVGLYAVRMEGHYTLPDPSYQPLEVTFTWRERQVDYTTVQRSHTRRIEDVPFTYHINVGGADHPIVESLTVNLAGARGEAPTYRYSDGEDVGGEKWIGEWEQRGRNLAVDKPYTLSHDPSGQWGGDDPDRRKLTDGVVGPAHSGGVSYQTGAVWSPNTNPVITVDLEEPTEAVSFGLNFHGYPGHDPLKGEVNEEIEVLVSEDGETFRSLGYLDTRVRWIELPVNFMWPDDEHLRGHTYRLIPDDPVTARYVQYRIRSGRHLCVTEVELLDRLTREPYDLRLALPADAPTPRR